MKRAFQILAVLLFLVLMFPLTAAPAPGSDSYSAGVQALQSGDSHKAVTLLSKAIESHPREFRYYNDRGIAYRLMGDLEKAVQDYSKAIELRPDYTNALNNRGVVHLQQGSYDKAIQDFSEALKFGGLESKIYTNLGAAYAAKGDYQRAIKHFDAAISLRPMDYRAFILMGEILEKTADKERALKMFRLGLGLIPDTALSNRVEKKVAAIEKILVAARQNVDKGANIQSAVADKANPEKSPPGQPAKPDPGRTRQIMLARPTPSSIPDPPKNSVAPVENGMETPEGLERRARARIMGKIAPTSAEILRQGQEFLEKNDPTKALVRFEDTLQLEKRKKNDQGVAWSSFEIGRVYSKLGDQVKGTSYLDAALKIFRKAKASDEIILTLLELAASKARAGQKDHAAAFYSAATDQAVSSGHQGLSKLIANLAAGIPYQQPKPTVASAKQVKAEERTASLADQTDKSPAQMQDQRKTVTAGQAPAPRLKQTIVAPIKSVNEKPPPKPVSTQGLPGQTAQTGLAKSGGPQPEIARKPAPAVPAQEQKATVSQQVSKMMDRKAELERLAALSKNKPTHAKPVPVETKVTASGSVGRGKAPGPAPLAEASARRSGAKEPPAENRVREDIATLKKLRASNDEAGMVSLLERLAGHYIKRKDYRKASYCLTASLALQDKLGFDKGRQRALYQSALLKEKLGDPAGALEELTRAIAISDVKTAAKTIKELDAKARNIATRLQLDAAAVLAGFQMLWKARVVGDDQTETEALYAIGKLYDKAEKPAEALNYYERSSASLLVDKARMHQKMGNARLAQDAYDNALEAFRKLDYSRYISLVKKIRTPRVFSRH